MNSFYVVYIKDVGIICDFLRQETCNGYDFENKLKLKIDIAMKKMEERAKKELVTSDSSG